jgi:hypothetical protein
MRKFILKIILVLAPILLFVVSVNYFGDAANLFSIGYEKKVADEILKGNNITNIYNYDQRLLEKHLINNSTLCPDVLVIGSSRVMLINSSYFKKQTFLNAGVIGASIEDLLAIYQLFEQKKCLPKKIILGLDPWTLNIYNGQTRWTTLNQEYFNLYNRLTNKNKVTKDEHIKSKYSQLVSPSYFISSFKKILLASSKPIATKTKINKTFTKLVDGSITYDLERRSATPDEIEKRAIDFISADIYSIENFDKLSTEIRFLLKKFIEHLRSNHIEISFFLAPYHPKVYSFIAKSVKYSKVIESEKYFRDLGLNYEIKVIGSFNPNRLNMDGSFFYDGMHCNEKGIEKILINEYK